MAKAIDYSAKLHDAHHSVTSASRLLPRSSPCSPPSSSTAPRTGSTSSLWCSNAPRRHGARHGVWYGLLVGAWRHLRRHEQRDANIARIRRPDCTFLRQRRASARRTADIVTVMFAMHEAPMAGRRRILRNAARVAKREVRQRGFDCRSRAFAPRACAPHGWWRATTLGLPGLGGRHHPNWRRCGRSRTRARQPRRAVRPRVPQEHRLGRALLRQRAQLGARRNEVLPEHVVLWRLVAVAGRADRWLIDRFEQITRRFCGRCARGPSVVVECVVVEAAVRTTSDGLYTVCVSVS